MICPRCHGDLETCGHLARPNTAAELAANMHTLMGGAKIEVRATNEDDERAKQRAREKGRCCMPLPFAVVIVDVEEERRKQDAQWGGPECDDQRLDADWCRYIHHQIRKILEAPALYHLDVDAVLAESRSRFVKIAALAVAAIESICRIQNKLARHRDGA